MKIRDKLLLGFGLYILLAVILASFAYKELRTIGTRLDLVETADDITNTLLEVRRYEKNYLLYRDAQDLEALQGYLATLRAAVGNIAGEIVAEIGRTDYEMLRRAMDEYGRLVGLIAQNTASQSELTDRVRSRGREVEHRLSGPAHDAFLDLRRHEKNIMLFRDAESYQRFERALDASGRRGDQRVAGYAELVAELHARYQAEKSTVESLRQTARVIQAFTEDISRRERTDIASTLRTSVVLLFTALGTIIIIGTAINIKLARSIVTPLIDLERVTKKIARGDFSERIQVRGQDEVASLAGAFNQMEQKLDHAMTSLDAIIKQLQEKQSQLVEAEKLASLGKLAAGIAHEINNPLTSVLTFSNLMLEQCPPGDPRHEKLKLMARETDRARNIIRQLLNFGRESVIRPVKIDINQPVTEITESLVAQEAFKNIELAMDLAEGLPEVYADPAQLGQVVLNMLLNAVHATTPPGRIEIRTQRNGGQVEIVIADTGKGIPEEHLRKIFDPFFTTKDSTRGTGLGLAVSYGIIKKHGGDIVVESAVGKGTTFTVRLPVYG